MAKAASLSYSWFEGIHWEFNKKTIKIFWTLLNDKHAEVFRDEVTDACNLLWN